MTPARDAKLVKQAKFNIGQIVRHVESGHRGVVVDIDPEFLAEDVNSLAGAIPRAQKADPWYHVLIDEQDMQAYIAEKQLQRDQLGEPINHAYLDEFFSGFDEDHYISRRPVN